MVVVARSPEVLIVHIETKDEPEEVIIFRRFSSSLSNSTAAAPSIPVISDEAKIIVIENLTLQTK